MTDLVERLRTEVKESRSILVEAADEIERLRGEVAEFERVRANIRAAFPVEGGGTGPY